MKKIALMTVALVLLVSAAAWAGERSKLLSEKELSVIESIAEKAYPRGTKVYMVVSEDLFKRFTVIEFIKESHKVSLRMEIYPHWARMTDAESVKIGERVGVKVIEGIEKILNENPRAALGNIIK